MDAVRRVRLLSVAILAIVFGSGILVGFALDRQMASARAAGVENERLKADAVDADADDDEDNDRPRRYLFDRVDPTPAQRLLIDSIVSVYQRDVREFHRDSRHYYDDGMRALVLETRQAIMGVLTAEQAARYDSLATARDRRNDDGRNGDGGNGNGGDRK